MSGETESRAVIARCPRCNCALGATEKKCVVCENTPPPAARVIDGKWRVLKQLGGGGMGHVYLAEDVELGRKVAIKVLIPTLTADAGLVARFLQEARLLAQADHPNLVPIYGMGKIEGTPYFVMKYLDGESLEQRLRRGCVEVSEAKRILGRIALGLSHLHALGCVHRDLKPANILLTTDGEVVILDLGVAQSSEPEGLTKVGMVVGTPKYMAPEQVLGAHVDLRADVYSLGVILFEMLTGHPPFMGHSSAEIFRHQLQTPPPRLPPEVHAPGGLADVVAVALRKNPDERYATVSALLDAVNAAFVIVAAPQVGVRRHRFPPPAIAGGVVALTLLAAFAVLGWQGARQSPVAPTPMALALQSSPIVPKSPQIGRKEVAVSPARAEALPIARGAVAASIARDAVAVSPQSPARAVAVPPQSAIARDAVAVSPQSPPIVRDAVAVSPQSPARDAVAVPPQSPPIAMDAVAVSPQSRIATDAQSPARDAVAVPPQSAIARDAAAVSPQSPPVAKKGVAPASSTFELPPRPRPADSRADATTSPRSRNAGSEKSGLPTTIGVVRLQLTARAGDEPLQAWVDIDGVRLGKTPLAAELPPGAHQVRVSLAGFVPVERTLSLRSQPTILDVELAP